MYSKKKQKQKKTKNKQTNEKNPKQTNLAKYFTKTSCIISDVLKK